MHLTKYQIIEYMLELDDDLKTAYELKEDYRNFNFLVTKENAEAWLSDLLIKFENSNIQEFKPFIKTIKNWKTEIINSFNRINGFRISNARLERINRDIKHIFSTSCGSTNFQESETK
jgi:transposase